jgi:nucleoside-diphosphate-sugar epimerase
MKALFIGGTGLISSAVSKLAVAEGIDLSLLNRGRNDEFFPAGARQIVADRQDEKAMRNALRDQSFDVVVDWLAFTPAQASFDLSLFEGRTGQFIFISSASAYQKPPSILPITESTPLRNPFWQYSRDKIACEEMFNEAYRANGFPVTVVRPSHTYGPPMIPAGFSSWSHPWTLVDRMRKGRRIVVHGDGTSLWTMTHNTDFARAFIGLMGNARALGHSVHITSDEVLTWDQITRAIGKAAGVEPKITHVASELIAAFDPDSLGSLLGDKSHCAVFDNSKIKSLVPGFTATVSFAEGVRQSVQWFEGHPDRCTIDDAFNSASDRILHAHDAAISAAKH